MQPKTDYYGRVICNKSCPAYFLIKDELFCNAQLRSYPDKWDGIKYIPFYDKEYSDKKPNTVRIVSSEEDRLIQSSEIDYIKIKNTVTGEEFMRLLTDITRFVYNDLIMYIFSFYTKR